MLLPIMCISFFANTCVLFLFRPFQRETKLAVLHPGAAQDPDPAQELRCQLLILTRQAAHPPHKVGGCRLVPFVHCLSLARAPAVYQLIT